MDVATQIAAEGNDAAGSASERPRGLRRALARIAAVPALVYGAWCGGLMSLQTRLIFPREAAGAPHTSVPPGAEQVWIRGVDDGSRVEGLYFATPESFAAPAPAVIYAHGNAELIGQNTHIAEMYLAMGINVLLAEYRGYGNSEGTPSEAAIVSDFVQFHDWLLTRPEVDPDKIFFHGRSLGGGVVAQLAARRRPAALILETTFTSIASFAWGYCVPPFLVRSPMRTDRVLPTLTGVPILIMHGRNDTIVPVSHGRRLRELAPWAAYYETDDDHPDFPSDRGAYERQVQEFLGEALGIRH